MTPRWRTKAIRGISAALLLCTGLWMVHLLHAAYCAFTWKNFLMSDYGVYTNTIWNLGHGNGFRFLVDHTYLRTHLSFSLALLGPLYQLWDDPMLLIVVQWLFLAGGAGVLWRTAARMRVPSLVSAAILFLYTGHAFTQSVMMSEFHGVSAYFLLVPWLVYCLEFRKAWLMLPFLIILGLREDAAFLLFGVLLYYARRDRWRAGYVYAAASFAYGLAAVFWLYPLLHEESLLGVRIDEEAGFNILGSIHRSGLTARLQSSAWLLLTVAPFLCFVSRAWVPLLAFSGPAYAIAMASGMERQYSLSFHYPAALMAFGAAAAVVACGRSALGKKPVRALAVALLACAVTLATHLSLGFLQGGGRPHRVYQSVQPDGVLSLRLARKIPKEGLLVCNRRLAVYSANRRDLMTWQYRDPEQHVPDLIFCGLYELTDGKSDWVADAIRDGHFGVLAEAFPYFILQRGLESEQTAGLLDLLSDHTIVAATASGGGRNMILDGGGLVRHWNGNGSKAPLALVHGSRVVLDSGEYIARFTYRAAAPAKVVRGNWGSFSVYAQDVSRSDPLAQMPVPQDPRPAGQFISADLPFALDAMHHVEPRVIAGDAEMWIHSISFLRR